MKCFGDKAKTFHCKVVLLDEQELIQELQETTGGQDLLDVVFQHLNLIETSYFGLRYIDPSNQTHWLDPNKRLVKQLKGISPFTLYFSVKFYAADPTKLVEEITRYQFFLQIKQDILQGRLPVSTELAAELGSLAVQSELGDYDPRRHSPGYVSEFRFVANQSVALENKIAELHKKLVSYVPSKAELCYLEKVKWLDMYGVDLHPVLGEDSTEYFLGLTPSGIIVLRNKVKVGNYFWPRITKVYFKGRFFMLRVKDKNNGENTYGFETPSKSACKHLWQCCVEHHAFFRLTQAAGNNPQAMVSIGSKLRNSGRTEKDTITDAQTNVRPQTEFARTPSRRYQRRIVEGAQDTPRTEEMDNKPETRTIVSLPGTVTPVSHVYRSTSMTLAPRSDSPRSTRSAPYPSGLQRQPHSVLGNQARREARPSTRGESPRSVKSASAGRAPDGVERVPRRTSSVESQSSADSRSCNRSCSRHRRSRCRSSDGESEASSKCSSSKGHRRHHHHRHHHRRHRHHSDDSSEHHKHRHRRHRHRSNEKPEPQMVESSDQWARVQNGDTNSRSNTATVRDLTNGYMPSGHDDTEADTQVHHHSSRRKYRKHRSPSDSKQKNYPDEIRRHIEFNLQNTEGLSDAQLREIPYTKVETAKTVKIKYGSPKGKRHRSPKRSKSNSSERKSNHDSANPEKEKDEDENKQIDPTDDTTHKRKDTDKEIGRKGDLDNKLPNGSVRPCPRSSQASVAQIQPPSESPRQEGRAISPRSSPNRDSSPLKSFQEAGTLQRRRKETNQNSSPPIFGPKPTMANNHNRTPPLNGNGRPTYPNHNSSHNNPDDQNTFKTCNYVTSNYNSTSENSPSQSLHQNPPSEGAFPPLLRDSTLLTQNGSPVYRREPEVEDHQPQREEELNNGFLESNGGGFMNQCPTLLKNATTERGTHFTAVLKPQPSPQSSVTSGISVGSSSASTTVAETSEGEYQRSPSSYSNKYEEMCNNEITTKNFSYGGQPSANNIRNGFNGINRRYEDNFHLVKQSNRPHSMFNGHEPNQKMNMFNGHEPNQKVNMFNGHEHNQVNMLNGHEPNQVNMFNGHEPNQKVNMFNGHDEFNQKVNMFNGYESNPKMNNVENGKFQPKETRNRKYYSAFEEVKRHFEDHSVDRGYHTIEKTPVGSSVNFRNNYVSQNQKLAKERPNSFSYSQKSKLNGTSLNNEYHPKTFEKFNNPNYENPRIFKPILKSFASEDNLNTQTTVKERSKSTERLENVGTFSNNKNRVRWNLQEKTKNMINLKDDNIYYKPRDYNSLNRVIKPNNIHNVKNDVVYAGKGEIIEIKNNQIINIKSVPQQPSQITFKKDSNSKGFTNKNKSPFLKDEISTEL